jgi:hypothetical protein
LAAFIGLADRDRFELSGANLEEWLNNPSKDILLKSQINEEFSLDEKASLNVDEVPADGEVVNARVIEGTQVDLFDHRPIAELGKKGHKNHEVGASQIDIEIVAISERDLKDIPLGGILTGLGFEERTLASNRILAGSANVGIVHAVRYNLPGYAEPIKRLWADADKEVHEIDNDKAVVSPPSVDGLALIDISGLSKPLIFKPVMRELIEKGRVLICHTSAAQHYPLQRDLELLLAAKEAEDPSIFLERLSHVLKGESGPYTDMRLLEGAADPSRARAMLAFASSKHERLFSLLDKREFDYIEVIAPEGNTPRARVAQFAAEFLCQSYKNATVSRIDTSDLPASVSYLDQRFLDLYGNSGANIEIGLTGSKIQAVAAAILSARRKVSQAWYLAPHHFEEKSFSTGVAGTRIFDIRVSNSRE